MEWISVKDKPIPLAKYVLAGLFVHNRFSQSFRFEEEVIYHDDGIVMSRNDDETGWALESYTHWQPLPPPPTNKEEL